MARRRDAGDLLPLTHGTYHVLLALAQAPLHGYGIIQEIATHHDRNASMGSIFVARTAGR